MVDVNFSDLPPLLPDNKGKPIPVMTLIFSYGLGEAGLVKVKAEGKQIKRKVLQAPLSQRAIAVRYPLLSCSLSLTLPI